MDLFIWEAHRSNSEESLSISCSEYSMDCLVVVFWTVEVKRMSSFDCNCSCLFIVCEKDKLFGGEEEGRLSLCGFNEGRWFDELLEFVFILDEVSFVVGSMSTCSIWRSGRKSLLLWEVSNESSRSLYARSCKSEGWSWSDTLMPHQPSNLQSAYLLQTSQP